MLVYCNSPYRCLSQFGLDSVKYKTARWSIGAENLIYYERSIPCTRQSTKFNKFQRYGLSCRKASKTWIRYRPLAGCISKPSRSDWFNSCILDKGFITYVGLYTCPVHTRFFQLGGSEEQPEDHKFDHCTDLMSQFISFISLNNYSNYNANIWSD